MDKLKLLGKVNLEHKLGDEVMDIVCLKKIQSQKSTLLLLKH
jgi:hypothetical protein